MPTHGTGIEEAADWLGEIADRLRDPSPALDAEARAVEQLIDASFAARRAPDGAPWPPRKTTTSRPGRSTRPRSAGRQGTGRLQGDTGARVEGGVLVIEARAPYAGFVHGGTRTMSARPFLPAGPDLEIRGAWADGIEERLADYFVGDE